LSVSLLVPRIWNWSSSCGRQSTSSSGYRGSPWGPWPDFILLFFFRLTITLFFFWRRPLTRKRVCSLQCNHSLVRLLTPNNHTLPSHLRLCSLSVASYDSQGLWWKYSNLPFAVVLLAADSHSTSSSGYRASLWNPWPHFILLFFFRLTIALFFFLSCPLWRESGSVVYSAITHWSQLYITVHYRLIWDCIPFLLLLTTRRDYTVQFVITQ
jgi:hypothetical protein